MQDGCEVKQKRNIVDILRVKAKWLKERKAEIYFTISLQVAPANN